MRCASAWPERRLAPLLRLTAIGGALARRLVVVERRRSSSARRTGASPLVALPLLVAVVVARAARVSAGCSAALARRSALLSSLAIALGGVVAWSGDATWAIALHVGAAAVALARRCSSSPALVRGEPAPLALGARLPHADEAADHVAAPRSPAQRACSSARRACRRSALFAVTMVGLALASGGAKRPQLPTSTATSTH